MSTHILPSAADIEAAYLHGRWLRGQASLGSESRMLADLSYEVQRLRHELGCRASEHTRSTWAQAEDRARQVREMAKTHTQKEIAAALGIERTTVAHYLSPRCKAANRAGIA